MKGVKKKMKNLNGYAMDLSSKVRVMRLAAQLVNGSDGKECQELVACFVPQLIQLEKQLTGLAAAIDQEEMVTAHIKHNYR